MTTRRKTRLTQAESQPERLDKTTLTLDHDLYVACRKLALERDTTFREIAITALREWLQRKGDREDHRAGRGRG